MKLHSRLGKGLKLTNNTDGFANETEPAPKADIFWATPRRPQPNNVLHTEKAHQTDLHIEQGLIGKICVLVNGGQHTEDQANEDQHKSEMQNSFTLQSHWTN